MAALLASGCSGSEGDGRPASSPEPQATETTSDAVDEVVETEADIDIGGRSLYLRCWGEQVSGEPTVLLLAGFDQPTDTWLPMSSDLAADGHRVCAYDRAGIGRSEPAPEPRRTLKDQVADLDALLDAADLTEPVLLVAHSAGAL